MTRFLVIAPLHDFDTKYKLELVEAEQAEEAAVRAQATGHVYVAHADDVQIFEVSEIRTYQVERAPAGPVA